MAVLEERDRQEAQNIPATVSRGVRRQDLPLAAVLEGMRLIMAGVAQQPELTRLYAVLQAESLDETHPAHDYFLRRQAMALDELTRSFALHVARPRDIARQIHALMDGLSLQWLREKQAFNLVAEWNRAVARLFPAPRRTTGSAGARRSSRSTSGEKP